MSEAIHDQIISLLRDKRWALAAVEPSFRENLFRALPELDRATSTTALTARFYRNAILEESEPPSYRLVVADNENAFWTQAMDVLPGGAKFDGEFDSAWFKALNEAAELIAEASPETGEMLRNHISYIATVSTDAFRSVSHPHYFATLFLVKNLDPKSLANSIVHELGHQELFLLNLVDRLIEAESDYHLIHAPYQNRPRPPIGRLHSAHALFRMIGLGAEIKFEKTDHYRDLLKKTVASFLPEETTPFTKRILNEVY